MIEIKVSAGAARLLQTEVLTCGRVGLRCRLHFDAVWQGLRRVAVIAGSAGVDLPLDGDEFTVPPECLAHAGDALNIGLYGTSDDGRCVIPTLWVNCGEIRAGTVLTENPEQERTQSLLSQLLALTAEAQSIAERLQQDAERGRFSGACFTPAVSPQGVLSWTNDGSRENPPSVDLTAAVLAALPDGDEVSY